MKMKRNSILYISALLLLLSACRKDFKDVPKLKTALATVYPEHFAKREAGNVDLELTNMSTGEKFIGKSDEHGKLSVPGLIRGAYTVLATKIVDADEAFELVGVRAPFPVNGSVYIEVMNETGETNINMNGSNPQPLVFKEIYYTGSRTPSNGTYFSDQFYEIYNNTDTVVYADGLCIGNTGGGAGNTPTARTWGFRPDQNYVYLQNVWMIPGSGKEHPIQPGTSIVIAQDGIDHKTDPLGNPASPVNLGVGIAQWESYVPRADNRDLDADVPNLLPVYLGSVGFDWLAPVFGPGMVIFKHPDVNSLPFFTEPTATAASLYMQVPIANVYDAVDCLANSTAFNFKRIPDGLDAGFKYCSGTYVGEGLRRKIARVENGRKILQDLNNSTIDFESVKPPVVRQ